MPTIKKSVPMNQLRATAHLVKEVWNTVPGATVSFNDVRDYANNNNGSMTRKDAADLKAIFVYTARSQGGYRGSRPEAFGVDGRQLGRALSDAVKASARAAKKQGTPSKLSPAELRGEAKTWQAFARLAESTKGLDVSELIGLGY